MAKQSDIVTIRQFRIRSQFRPAKKHGKDRMWFFLDRPRGFEVEQHLVSRNRVRICYARPSAAKAK